MTEILPVQGKVCINKCIKLQFRDKTLPFSILLHLLNYFFLLLAIILIFHILLLNYEFDYLLGHFLTRQWYILCHFELKLVRHLFRLLYSTYPFKIIFLRIQFLNNANLIFFIFKFPKFY